MVQTTVLGYPRIGPNRELKRAVEGYWAGKQNQQSLIDTAAQLRKDTWALLRDAELDGIPSNTFSYYDQVLDTSLLIGAVPQRFAELSGLDQYFAMARGTSGVEPMEMTKWFDTNYHYLVPELDNIDSFQLSTEWNKPLAEYLEAKRLGIETRPVLVGPVTYLLLAKPANLERLESLVEVYVQLLAQLADAGCQWVQFDEPALAADRTEEELRALRWAYARLAGQASRPKILVTCSYGSMNGGLAALSSTPVEGIGVDLAAGESAASVTSAAAELKDKVLYAGLVNGRNVWRTDLRAALAEAATLLGSVGELVVSTSCSLLHVPMDLDLETELDPKLRARLAFAKQKVEEVVLLGKALTNGPDAVSMPSPPAADSGRDPRVAARLSGLGQDTRRTAFSVRAKAQDNGTLPQLPTTTIGSFPQTKQIRTARADLRAGRISQEQYDTTMRAEIDSVIALQEEIGIDLLVHGEPERNDMVQYFAEQLAGYASTEHGWVQSYGSRCVRPPILHGDVSRPEPMTVDWTTYAQSRTRKPVKGMLTGPVTMLAWSFVREDQPQSETARQVALALRDEIHDLESAGIGYIQLDEPALREKLPLRVADQRDYLGWSTAAFRLATSGVADSTQIHTHMCYSEFGEIVDAIGELDADVTSVEAARSKMELVEDLRTVGYVRGIGPGVYDIHSPRVPSVAEIEESLRLALNAVEPERLWSNPDCGLKTRGYTETEAALRNMVEATRRVRETL